jgi:hypothetical protein
MEVTLNGGQMATIIPIVQLDAGLLGGLRMTATGLCAATQTVLALVCSHGSIKLDAGALSQRTKTEPKMWDPDNEKLHGSSSRKEKRPSDGALTLSWPKASC